ncbi:SIMPL domain-containing protein [Fusobacterium sp. PH5-44]|uniref:SIMPL domain-containing protein n=1 Tax=unclassified Fusobacterium TaxID=2648384 RepID=UPI003D1AF865
MKKVLLLIFISSLMFGTEQQTQGKSAEEIKFQKEQLHYGKKYVVTGFIQLKGVGRVEIKPESIILNFTLNTQTKGVTFGTDKTSREKASEENAKIISEFKLYLKSIGVKDDDIVTIKYDSSSGKITMLDSGEVTHSIKVTFDVGTDIGAVLKKIESTPIKHTGDIFYGISEKTRREGFFNAQQSALEDANKQAENMAKLGGALLGDIRFINTFPANSQNMRDENMEYYRASKKSMSYELPPISATGVVVIMTEVECAYDLIKEVRE